MLAELQILIQVPLEQMILKQYLIRLQFANKPTLCSLYQLNDVLIDQKGRSALVVSIQFVGV